MGIDEKRQLIEPDHQQIPIVKQCELIGLARSSWYYVNQGEGEENLELMRQIDRQ
jgi:putative transposase